MAVGKYIFCGDFVFESFLDRFYVGIGDKRNAGNLILLVLQLNLAVTHY
jgi:hypothetical protein